MIYITGDTHREFSRFDGMDLREEDLVIVLGDAGINYCLDERDEAVKEALSRMPCSFLFIRGNHEARPEGIASYRKVRVRGTVTGEVYMEERFPKLMFAAEGLCEIGGRKCFICGGAYSIDKFYRLEHGLRWFPDEELTDEEMEGLLAKAARAGHVSFVLTHTCPAKYIPEHTFKVKLDRSRFSLRMEEFLDRLEETLDYDRWYCGHYHTSWSVDRLRFLYYDILELADPDHCLDLDRSDQKHGIQEPKRIDKRREAKRILKRKAHSPEDGK